MSTKRTAEVPLDDVELSRRLAKVERLDNRTRGSYLALFTHIDWAISEIITTHFLGMEPKRVEFVAMIGRNPALSLRSKIGIVETILKKDYRDLYAKNIGTLKRLKKLNGFRNILAHSAPVGNERFLREGKTDRFDVMVFRKGRGEVRTITVAEIKKRFKEARTVFKALTDLWIALTKVNP